MKVMKLKVMLIARGLGFFAFLWLLAFVAIFISNEEDLSNGGDFISDIGGISVSADVLKHQPMVEKYAQEYGISEYVSTLLAIIQVESGGKVPDVMQSSESLGLPPNSLGTEASIQQGTKYFSDLLNSAERNEIDINGVIQAYNYGGAFIDYVAKRGSQYSFELAENFAKERSGGSKVTYSNPIAIKKNGDRKS